MSHTKKEKQLIINYSILYGIALCLGVLVFAFTISYLVSAWTEPATAPPGGNVDTPLNVGILGQSKAGGLILNTGNATTGLIVAYGKVGIDITTPVYTLDVNGQVHASGDICTDAGGGKCLSSSNPWITSGDDIYYSKKAPDISPDSYTKLLIQANGDSNSFIDSSSYNKTIAAYGNTTQSSVQYKFGGKSAYFDGNGDYLSLNDSDDWNFETKDFTIDWWQKGGVLIGKAPALYNRWVIYTRYSSGMDSVSIYDSSLNLTISSPIVDIGNWHHFAVVRYGTTIRVYADGISGTPQTSTNAMTSPSAALKIMTHEMDAQYRSGYIDELRISKGIARWTADFTPPATPYASTTDTIGNVGIGTNSPSQKLEVGGNILATGDVCNGFGSCLSQLNAWIGSQPIAGGTDHNRAACTNKTSVDGVHKGVLVDIGLSNPVCRFEGNNCPDGWLQYKSYSTSIPISCYHCDCDCDLGNGVCGAPIYGGYTWAPEGRCTTGFHSFSDKPRETCTFAASHGLCNQICGLSFGGTCTALYSQVGCY